MENQLLAPDVVPSFGILNGRKGKAVEKPTSRIMNGRVSRSSTSKRSRLAKVISMKNRQLRSILSGTLVETASGADLDVLGRICSVFRIEVETDADYRDRIKNRLQRDLRPHGDLHETE